MRWTQPHIQTYQQAKEYVDTAIIPLVPLQWGKSEKQIITMGEFTGYLSESLEKQFTGRVFFLPSFTYLTSESIDERVDRLKAWDNHFYREGFKYIIYVTSDAEWKAAEKKLPDELLWMPASSPDSLEASQFKRLIEQQVEQIMPIFTAKWQSEPLSREN
jgi:hypothetical protein